MDMADEQEHPHRRTAAKAENEASQEVEKVEAQEGEAPPPVVDPYKMVYSPWELPANTAAASAIAAQLGDAVDPEAPISDERKTQAEAAIQAHQDSIQEVAAGMSEDPRLSGTTFQEHAAKQAEEAAARAAEKEEAPKEEANA